MVSCVSSGRSIYLFGTKTSRPADPKVSETGSKNFGSGSRRIITREATFTSTPWLLDLWILVMSRNSTINQNWFRAYTTSWRTLHQSYKALPPGCTATKSSKGHSSMFSSPLLQGDRAMLGQVKLVNTGPLLHFICSEVSFLVRNDAV